MAVGNTYVGVSSRAKCRDRRDGDLPPLEVEGKARASQLEKLLHPRHVLVASGGLSKSVTVMSVGSWKHSAHPEAKPKMC